MRNIHVVFRRNNSGTMDLFVNGVLATTDTNKTNWRMDGGAGYLGSNFAGSGDLATGALFGVASYDVALTDSDISDLYTAYHSAIPEMLGICFFSLGENIPYPPLQEGEKGGCYMF